MNMNDDELRTMIKQTLRQEPLPDLNRDLWPRMQARLAGAHPTMPWLDLALLAALVVLSVAFPDVVLGLLYHL